MNIFKGHKKWLIGGVALILAIALTLTGLQFAINPETVSEHSKSITIGQHEIVFTIGMAEAATETDYECDGVADDVQFQAAMDALPVTGGKIEVLGGNYNFAATVSRAIDDVTIEGVGAGTYFAYNGVSAIFSAGSQSNWTFRDFSTDAGGITYSSSTNFVIQNVLVGTTQIGKDVRTATYVVAASDAPAHVRAQADYVVSGDAEDEIQAAINALTAGRTQKEKVLLIGGNFSVDSAGVDESGHSYAISIPSYTIIELRGRIVAQSAVNVFWIENNTEIDIIGGEIDGNKSAFADPGNYHRHNGIWINRGSFITIQGISIYNFHSSPIHADALLDGLIADNYLYNSDYSAVHAGAWSNGTGADGTGTTRTKITRNIIDDTGEIACAYTGSNNEISYNIIKSTISTTPAIVALGSNLQVVHNEILDADQAGIMVYGVDGGAWGYFPAQDILLGWNDIQSTGIEGIIIYSVSGAAATRVRVEGGTINGTGSHAVRVYGVSGTPVVGVDINDVTILNNGGTTHSIRIEGGVHGGSITGCRIDESARTGICLLGNNSLIVQDFVIANNSVTNCGDNANNPGISLFSDVAPAAVQNILIVGNRCYDSQGSQTQTYGISESGSNSANITIMNNDTNGNLTGGIYTVTSGTIVRNNRGYVTENSGTATIASGSTVVQVTHGLSITPDEEKIRLVPLEDPTNTPGVIGVSANATATYFWIFCENDPGASNLDMGWSYAD